MFTASSVLMSCNRELEKDANCVLMLILLLASLTLLLLCGFLFCACLLILRFLFVSPWPDSLFLSLGVLLGKCKIISAHTGRSCMCPSILVSVPYNLRTIITTTQTLPYCHLYLNVKLAITISFNVIELSADEVLTNLGGMNRQGTPSGHY